MAHDYGTPNSRTKEIEELAASLVLRYDDCISYHVMRCRELGLSREEMFGVFNVGLVVGESIVIPCSGQAGTSLAEIEEDEE